MKTQILITLLFVSVIQTFAQNGPHQFAVAGSGCTSPTGLKSSHITQSSATISWNTVSAATSYSLQYESTGNWINVFVTDTFYTLTGLAPNTTYAYHLLSVCSDGYSDFSAISYFTTTGNGNNCTSKGNSTKLEFINRVKFGAINNLSGDNGGYKDYTSLSANLAAGHVYTIKLTPRFHVIPNIEYWTVYIDYNHNNNFRDSGERVFNGSSSSLVTGSVTIPSSVIKGITHMRVQMHYGSFITNPCATFDYGEVEDYTVNLHNGGFTEFTATDNFAKANTPSTAVNISPNPIQGSDATVTYTVTRTGRVALRIIDIYGRLIKTLDLDLQRAGVHSYNLNQMQNLSGNYFIKIEQGNELIGEAKIIVSH